MDKDFIKMNYNLDELDEGQQNVHLESDKFGILNNKQLREEIQRNLALDKQNPFGFKDYPKYGDKKQFKYLCVLQAGDITILNVILESINAERIPIELQGERHFMKYKGIPNFYNLSDNLQLAFLQYIQSFGIQAELFNDIELISAHLIQKKYMNWLQKHYQHFCDLPNNI
ncbi:Mitochondrial glycoprotein [Pseudocohnilembus persalinus]|uniref:Mitochondrial glycoprotein n=1 Tax=Pseudocohnilembus persalinus TaxID=266149 RepID=A0A0V0QRA6_PSEPJ|nr:Mitochondrial glycoprotein [Pseudocohnilembus persalinus]|eukprot:KRX04721.1 Mitochondrial glycoprotein [Pseudocohnilembus persalinus]